MGKSYEGLCELVVKDQFMSICCKDLSVHLREKSTHDLEELGHYAERYLSAHDHELISITGGLPASDDGNSTGREEELRCYKCNQAGHKMKNCQENTSGRGPVQCYNCHRSGHMAKDCRVKKPPVGGVKYAAAAVRVDSFDVKDGKLLLKDGGTVGIITSMCAQGIGHTNLPIADGYVGNQKG